MRVVRRSGLVGGALALLIVLGAGTALAGTPASGGDGVRRVALGDSWAAGAAAAGVDPASGTCRRSVWAYPAVTARAAGETAWTSRACASGTGGDDGQLDSLADTTEVVTATVGADATGLGLLGAACGAAGTPARCDEATARFDRALASLPRALDASLGEIRKRAPRAAVTVTGYPLIAEGRTCATGPADAARAARLDDAVARLDAALADRTKAAGLRFVDVRAAFAGHGVCGAEPWLTPLTGDEPLLAGGPTAAGHAAGYVAALAATGPEGRPSTPSTPPTTGPATPPTTEPQPARESRDTLLAPLLGG